MATSEVRATTDDSRDPAPPLRILLTVKKRGWNGETAHVLDLAVGYSALGHQAAIATRGDSVTAARARAAGIRVVELELLHEPHALGPAVRDIRRLRRELADTDVVHTHASWDTWLVAISRRLLAAPPAMLRTRHNLKPIRTHALNRRLYGREITRIVTPSHTVAADVARYPFIDVGRVRTIPHGIDLARFTPDDDERAGARLRLRASLGLPHNATLIGFLGRVTRRKRADLFLTAAERLAARHPAAHFVIAGQVGGGREWCAEFRRRVDALGRRARALGFVEDAPGFLAGLDIVIHPAPDEAFGLAAVEAAAMGPVVVAPAAAGTSETVDDGWTGLHFDPDDADDCARQVSRVIRDGELRARLSRQARARVERKYDARRMLLEHVRAYRQALGGCRSAPLEATDAPYSAFPPSSSAWRRSEAELMQ